MGTDGTGAGAGGRGGGAGGRTGGRGGGAAPRNRAERRAARAGEGRPGAEARTAEPRGAEPAAFDQDAFLALAGGFIDQANRRNRTIDARNVALALRWAAARYEAHVAKNVSRIGEHEPFVEESLRGYAEMLRQHLADPEL